eukprot:Skav212390  [mRNA]  locus=scaffold673:38668:46774:- [translate_table: standard]
MVMDTCGAENDVSFGFPQLLLFAKSTTSHANHPGIASFSSQQHLVIAPGGAYRLCWYIGSTDLNSSLADHRNFIVDAGKLEIMGPYPLQQSRTCVAGQICTLKALTVGRPLQEAFALLGGNRSIDDLLNMSTPEGLSGDSSANSMSNSSSNSSGNLSGNFSGNSSGNSSGIDEIDITTIGSPAQAAQAAQAAQSSSSTRMVDTTLWSRVMVLDTCGPARDSLAGHSTLGFPNSGLGNTLSLRIEDSGEVSDTLNGTFTVMSAFTAVTWGVVPITAAGGQYRLCWCGFLSQQLSSNASNQVTNWTSSEVQFVSDIETFPSSMCSDASRFVVDIGSLSVIGPQKGGPGTAGTCVSGQTCRLGFFHPDEQGHLLVSDTCGTSSVVPGFSWTSRDNSELTWGSTPISALGGEYRLCWCRFGDNISTTTSSLNLTAENQQEQSVATTFDQRLLFERCQVSTDFVVDIGSLFLVGPRARVHRTCISGLPCSFDFGDANHLSHLSLMLLETCGTSTTLGYSSVSASTTSPSMSMLPIAPSLSTTLMAPGGFYRLCWCWRLNNGTASCNLAEDHLVDAGSLYFMGPNPLQQDRTCLSGRACRIKGISSDLDNLNHLEGHFMLLATCGYDESASNTSKTSNSSFNSISSGSSAWGSSVNGTSPLDFGVLSAGTYRLCWCSAFSTCMTASNFQTDTGEMTIIGPYSGQDRTCIAGMTCSVDRFYGHGLSDLDFFMILSTCGESSRDPSGGFGLNFGDVVMWNEILTAPGGEYRLCWTFARAWKRSRLGPSRTLPHVLVGTGLVAFNGSSTLMLEDSLPLALGGQYKLCWCGSNSPCSNAQDAQGHSVEAGDLILQGPSSSQQDRTCVSGRTCVVDGIQGQDLLDSDVYLIQDTCGSNQILASTVKAGQSVHVTASGAVVNWGRQSPHTMAGGLYKLCWCTDRLTGANISLQSLCTSAPTYMSTVGNLALRGPAPLQQDRTCISGQVCKIEHIAGFQLDFLVDSVVILDTCGNPSRQSSSRAFRSKLQQGGIVDFGPGSSLLTGGRYRLCWCGMDAAEEYHSTQQSNLSHCQLATDFQVDFGALDIVGPAQNQEDSTCVSGRACNLWHIKGHFMESIPGHFLILDTCSMPMRTPTSHFGQGHGNRSVVSTGNISSPSFVLEDVPQIGGEYRLCWCGPNAGGGCSAEAAFARDAGQVFVLGPRPLQQDRTCIAGRSCTVEDILGFGLSSKTQAMILDTCGVASFGVGIATAGTTIANRSSFVWEKITGKGGGYRMCWCADTDMVAFASIPTNPEMSSLKLCENPQDFNVDFGRLDLIGPHQVDQSFTCVSGQSCVLKGFQYDMSLGDSILVLDSCGKGASLVPHLVQEPVSALPVNLSFSWGIRQTPQGGEYRLCWCSKRPAEGAGSSSNMTDGSPCQAAEHFAVDFGSLRMIGPVSTHTRTCVVGYPCRIAGLEGKDLQVGDSYLILDTCGLASHLPSSPAGFLQTATGALGTEILFPFVTSRGGAYRICWCAQGFPCQGFDDFRVDAGQLVLQGVLPEQTFTCIRGRPCHFSHVQGIYVGSQTAEFLLMATCSSNPGSLMNSAVASARAVPGTDVWWEMSLTFPGGQYRLCWCSTIHGGGATWADNSTISTSEWQELSLASRGLPGPSFNLTRYNQSACLQSDFRVDVGALHIVGPRTGHAFTCISGLTCSVSSVEGLGLTSNDSYIILDTCGIPTSVPRFSSAGEASLSADGTVVSWGEAVVTAAGGEYRLCWCKQMAGLSFDVHSSHNYTSSCESPTNFLSDVGTLLLIGVDLEQPRTCVSGSTCMIDGITGTYLQHGDALLLLDTCGLGRAPPNIYHVTGGKPVRAFENISGHAWYLDVTETPILGGDYRLCWCSSLGSACSLSTEFQVDFGQLSVQGPRPLQQSFTCISGRTCNFDMIGAGPDVEDSLMILSTCGSAAGQLAAYSTYRTSINKLQLPGDTYRLCWCPFAQFSHFAQLGNSSEANLSQVRRCHTLSDFNIDFGHLEVIGVLFSQDRTCISGQTCSIDSLLGVHLSSFDAWSVFDTCGFQHVAGFPDDANVVVDVQDDWVSTARISWNAPVTSHGGTYRLCWCSRAGNQTNATHQCSRFDSFVDVGKFEVLGPSQQISWRPTQRGHCGIRPAFPEAKVLDTFDNLTIEECRAQCDQLHPLCQVGWYSFEGPNEGQCKIMETCATIVDDSEPTLLLLPHKARPSPFQPRTCISGQMCTIGGLLGNGLTEDDSYMLLETCGFADALVHKVGKGGVALLSSKSNSTGVDISWESPISAAGDTYRLCWCGADASCSSSESFRTDAGSFVLIGPSLRQDRTCVSGLSCLVDGIVGHHLADGDWLWILDTCGSSSTGDGFFADSWLAKPAVASGTSFLWNDLDTVPGGQ